ncbi:hypothetical protein FHT08_000981 [Xanthomonas campestris]|nr:hypothetical protein [Xanthomonas sp. CFBP 8151]
METSLPQVWLQAQAQFAGRAAIGRAHGHSRFETWVGTRRPPAADYHIGAIQLRLAVEDVERTFGRQRCMRAGGEGAQPRRIAPAVSRAKAGGVFPMSNGACRAIAVERRVAMCCSDPSHERSREDDVTHRRKNHPSTARQLVSVSAPLTCDAPGCRALERHCGGTLAASTSAPRWSSADDSGRHAACRSRSTAAR